MLAAFTTGASMGVYDIYFGQHTRRGRIRGHVFGRYAMAKQGRAGPALAWLPLGPLSRGR